MDRKTASVFLCIAATVFIHAENRIQTEKNSIRFSAERVSLPGNEHLTLGGGVYRVYAQDSWYYGIGTYGALKGERGGFFTGGICSGYSAHISETWCIDAECFFGGGGGGSAPQGGGMMLRPSCMLFGKTGGVKVGTGFSYVWFPNGEISSGALCVAICTDFERAYTPGRSFAAGTTRIGLEPVQWRYYPVLCRYSPSDDSSTVAGKDYEDNIDCIGFGADRFLSEYFYVTGRVYGAYSGGIDGYAKVIGGAIFASPRFGGNRIRAEAGLLAGASGGGGVDTGGGFLIQPEIGLTADISDHFSFFVREGYLHTVTGNFDSFVTSLGISYSFTGYGFSGTAQNQAAFEAVPWRVGGSIKSYFPSREIEDKSGREHKHILSLVGVDADRMLGSNSYICAKAYGAFEGEAGGYAEGLLGLGLVLFQHTLFSFDTELCIGASGGGGVDTGNGLIAEICAGFEYRFSESFSFRIRAGWLTALEGEFESVFAEAGLTRSFGQLVKQ